MTNDDSTSTSSLKKNQKQELEARMTKVISDYTAQLTERTEHHMG